MQLSNRPGNIVRVRLVCLELVLESIFLLCKFTSMESSVTLTMVPAGFKIRAIADLKACLQRKNIFARGSSVLAFLGTLANVIYVF